MGAGSYATNKDSVSLCGSTDAVATGIWPFCSAPDAPAITWSNQSTGGSGTASVTATHFDQSFFICRYWFSWQATVPLTLGENSISVEQSRIVVTYDPDYVLRTDDPPTIIHVLPWGSDRSDQAGAVATDADHNIYVTGSAPGGLDGYGNMGNSDVFIRDMMRMGGDDECAIYRI